MKKRSDPVWTWIVATDARGVIGLNGKTPWWVRGELAFFRTRTMGRPVVVGRETYEAIGGPLEGRAMIVMTRQSEYSAPGCRVVHSTQEAIQAGCEEAVRMGVDEVMVAGGAQVYEAFRPHVARVCVTVLDAFVDGDRSVDLAWFRGAEGWSANRIHLVHETKKGGWRHRYEEWEKKV